MKKKLLLRGPVLSQSGYGEHARFVFRVLKSSSFFDIYIEPLPWGKTSWQWEETEERKEIDALIGKTQAYKQAKGQFDVALLVTIPNEWQRIAPLTIGVTAGIESNKISAGWIEKANKEVDKIIITSEFSKNGFENTSYTATNKQTGQQVKLKTEVPVSVVNYPVKEFKQCDLDVNLDYDFNFLAVAQWGPRKNVKQTIEWFVEEFIDQKVGLVLKISFVNNSIRDRAFVQNAIKGILRNYPDRKCKIYLLHGYMNHDEIHSLYKHPKIKALISLSHGEGYGLPLFEAAYCGLPIVTHNFGGQTDFLYADIKDKKGKPKKRALFTKVDYDLKQVQKEAVWEGVLEADSMWAHPKQGNVKMKLRELYKKHGVVKSQAKKLQKAVLKSHSEEKIYATLIEEILGYKPIEPKDFEGVSFCITTDGKKDEKLRATIKAIQNQITTKKTEIVVSGVVENLEDIEGITLVEASSTALNGMLAELRNLAANASTQEVICYMDDDMLLSPTWLWRLEEFSRTMGWEVLGNKILNPDGSRLWDRAIMNPHILVPYTHPECDKELYQTGGFSVHRREIFEKYPWDGSIPIYNEKHGGENEDIELSKRLHKAGVILMFDAENTTWHWDNNYTEVRGPRGAPLTLRKDVIAKATGATDFPPACDEFKSFLAMLGVESE